MADDQNKEPEKKDDTKDKTEPSDELRTIRAELDKMRQERDELLKKDQSLNDKVKYERDNRDKRESDSKQLESALTFNLTSSEFLKMNESILPKEISEIFEAASKEKYESAIQKANATKAAIIQSFFSQQTNVDMLTESQKSTLEDYLKLTKNGKEEKAREIYDNLFEPALGSLKRVKKAEELYRSKNGFRGDSKGDSQYKEKLMSLSRRHYLGEKV